MTMINRGVSGFQPDERPFFRSRQSQFWLFLVSVLPSLAEVRRYGKTPGAVLYLLFMALWVWVLLPTLARKMQGLPQIRRSVPYLVAAAMVFFTVLFLVAYPLSHSGRFGRGSDRADALNVSIPLLLTGKNPYTARTYFGNPITPLPGAMLLGSPFRMILGDAAYQDIAWALGLFLLLGALAATRVQALLLWLTLVFLNVEVFHDMMTGGDFGVNGIYVAATTYLLLHALSRPRAPGGRDLWKLSLLAAVWGLCLCSRLSYLVLVPFAFVYAAQVRGFLQAAMLTLIALAVYAMLVLPFYLHDPQHFAPLEIVRWKLTGSTHSAAVFFAGGVGFLAVLLMTAWAGRRYGLGYTFATSAAFLGLPVSLIVLSTYHRTGGLDLNDLSYGTASSVFAVVALLILAGRAEKQAGMTEEQTRMPVPPHIA